MPAWFSTIFDVLKRRRVAVIFDMKFSMNMEYINYC